MIQWGRQIQAPEMISDVAGFRLLVLSFTPRSISILGQSQITPPPAVISLHGWKCWHLNELIIFIKGTTFDSTYYVT